MSVFEVILIALAAVTVLATVAERLRIPYPVLLVLGGIALGLVPGLPRVIFQPDLVFLLFVPPLLLSTAWRASPEDLTANLRPIASLAVGLVVATMGVVALVTHWLIPGTTWPVAFVLGAIVSATDPAAVTAIAERLHLPSQIVSILEGESLGNDATSLVAYRTAVAAVVAGAFQPGSAALELAFATVVGVALGLVTAYLYVWLERHLDNAPVEVAITLLLPFIAYIPANQVGASGVLAVVAAGLYAGRREPEIRSAYTRLQATAVWDTLVFVLNGLIFVLLGLQLRAVLSGVSHRPVLPLVGDAAVVIVTVILVRIVWSVGVTGILALLRRAVRLPLRPLPWNSVPIVAWTGMRGAATLVLALAVPLTVNNGAPFPDREMLIFLAFCVIVATLVVQGLSLPALIRRTGLERDDTGPELAKARAAAHAAAVRRIDELARESTLPRAAARLRDQHQRLSEYYAARSAGRISQEAVAHIDSLQQLKQDVLDAQRQEMIELHNRGEITHTAFHTVLRELDLEERRRA